jgi:hypothetical protein
MPVSDEEQAGVLILQLDPVLEDAMVVAEVEAPVGRMPERTRSAYIYVQSESEVKIIINGGRTRQERQQRIMPSTR